MRNFLPLLCIAFFPASSALQQTIIHGLGGACKWAMLGNYTFHAFSRGFVDVFLWGVLCATMPTWDRNTGEFTGYVNFFSYISVAAVIEVRCESARRTTHRSCTRYQSYSRADTRWLVGAQPRIEGQHTLRQQVLRHCITTPLSRSIPCAYVASPSGIWPPPRTALFVASLSPSASASCTCPQVTPPFFFPATHPRCCRSSRTHAERVFKLGPISDMRYAPKTGLLSPKLSRSHFFLLSNMFLCSVCVCCVRGPALRSKGEAGVICHRPVRAKFRTCGCVPTGTDVLQATRVYVSFLH